METDNLELGEKKHMTNDIDSSDDGWDSDRDSDEDDDITTAGYAQLPQDPIENGEEVNCDDLHSKPEEEVLTLQLSHSYYLLFPGVTQVWSTVRGVTPFTTNSFQFS